MAVENGTKAWEAFQKEYFPLIISDWLMPVMDGLALFRKIRELPHEDYTYLVLEIKAFRIPEANDNASKRV